MKTRHIMYIALAVSFVILWLSIPCFRAAAEGGIPEDQPEWLPGVVLSLFPIAALTFGYVALKGFRHSKSFAVLLGLLMASLAWEFLADPWSIEFRLRRMPEAGMAPIILYMMIGTAFVLLSVFFFKRGIEE